MVQKYFNKLNKLSFKLTEYNKNKTIINQNNNNKKRVNIYHIYSVKAKS